MKSWMSIPLLAVLWIVQTTIVSDMSFFYGTADILLLALIAWTLQPGVRRAAWVWALLASFLAEYTSAMPPGSYLLFYLSAVTLAWFLRRRLWQSQILAMYFVVTLVTLAGYTFFYLLLWIFRGFSAAPAQVFSLVVFPSLFLNLLWAIPIYYWMRDLARRIYPEEMLP